MAPILFLLKRAAAALSVVFHRLETRAKFTRKGYPKNYVAIVSKGTASVCKEEAKAG